MPQYDYVCTMCGESVVKQRKISEREEHVSCPECTASCNFVPSLTASRRDHIER